MIGSDITTIPGRKQQQQIDLFGIDMVVAARALAELRLVSVFARIPPPTTHPN